MMEKISIIVPVYNLEMYISRCLDSILSQTYKNIEVIVINDGSKDKSLDVLKTYEKYENIKVYTIANAGVANARNVGLEKCTGEYVAFIDGDDWVEPNYIECLYRTLKDNEADISTIGYKKVYDGKQLVEKSMDFPVRVSDNVQAVKYNLCDIGMEKSPWAKLYKLSIFREHDIKYPIGKNFEDVATTYKAFYYTRKVAYSNEKLYMYFQREGSITKQPSKKNVSDVIEAVESIKEFLVNNGVYAIYEKAFTHFSLLIFRYVLYLIDLWNLDIAYEDVTNRFNVILNEKLSVDLIQNTEVPVSIKKQLIMLLTKRNVYVFRYRYIGGVKRVLKNNKAITGLYRKISTTR